MARKTETNPSEFEAKKGSPGIEVDMTGLFSSAEEPPREEGKSGRVAESEKKKRQTRKPTPKDTNKAEPLIREEAEPRRRGGAHRKRGETRSERTNVNLTPTLKRKVADEIDKYLDGNSDFRSLNDFVCRALDDYFSGRMDYPVGEEE